MFWSRCRRAAGDLSIATLIAAIPLGAALIGAVGPLRIELRLGPGDAPYVHGFAPEYEVEGRSRVHWTSPDATVTLPITVQGDAVELSYRLGRPQPERIALLVSAQGNVVDSFSPLRRGQVRHVRLPSSARPRTVEVHLYAPEVREGGRGVMLEWLAWRVPAAGRVTLTGTARLVAALVVAQLFLLLRLAGWRRAIAALLVLPTALVAAAGLRWNPWLVHRLLTGIPLALIVFGGPLAAGGRYLAIRGRATRNAVASLVLLLLGFFLLRAIALNHPDYYYPDLRSHARLAEIVRGAGWDFLFSPSRYFMMQGAWRHVVYGRTYAMPYSAAFHAPFAIAPLEYDSMLQAMKLSAAALSVLPIASLWLLARRLGASVWGALLLACAPAYALRLVPAFLAALLGHAVDMAFVAWLGRNSALLPRRRAVLITAAWMAMAELAYVSAIVVLPLFLCLLAAAMIGVAADKRHGSRQAASLLAAGLLGSLLAFALYYRDFVPLIGDLLGRLRSGELGGAHRVPQAILPLAAERTRVFLGEGTALAAAAGLLLLTRRRTARPLVLAWVGTYVVLVIGRARMPDVFVHTHDALFVTPLACLAAGQAIASIALNRAWGRALRITLLMALSGHGLLLQWRILAEQLAVQRLQFPGTP